MRAGAREGTGFRASTARPVSRNRPTRRSARAIEALRRAVRRSARRNTSSVAWVERVANPLRGAIAGGSSRVTAVRRSPPSSGEEARISAGLVADEHQRPTAGPRGGLDAVSHHPETETAPAFLDCRIFSQTEPDSTFPANASCSNPVGRLNISRPHQNVGSDGRPRVGRGYPRARPAIGFPSAR